MRIAISNIAWDPEHDTAVADILRTHGVDAIDYAPGKYFPDIPAATTQEMQKLRTWWQDQGIELTGMQSLLFGTQGLNLFGPEPVRQAMLERLAAVCRIGGGTGATRLVFGSPKNRDCSGLAPGEVEHIACSFFTQLGDIARDCGVIVCLEPNPPCYGANFMTNSEETAAVVASINHPAIRMQLDTGALAINGEDPAAVVARCGELIGHIHASEPDLVTLGTGGTDHPAVYRAVAKALPDHVVSIEMLTSKEPDPLAAIRRAVQHAVSCYRPEAPQP